MTTIRQLSNNIYGMDHIEDTEIQDGMCPDDTIRIELDNGSIVYCNEMMGSILFSEYYLDQYGDEECVSEGGHYDLTGDEDTDSKGLYTAILQFIGL